MALNFKVRTLIWFMALTSRKKLSDHPPHIARKGSEKLQVDAKGNCSTILLFRCIKWK